MDNMFENSQFQKFHETFWASNSNAIQCSTTKTALFTTANKCIKTLTAMIES
jgi:hypothetical protein